MSYSPQSSTNVSSSLIKRDANGNFSANVITADLNGNAATATVASSALTVTGSLAGDVQGTLGATVVATVGSVAASSIAAAILKVNNATSTNTSSTLVLRDASGNFSAGVITASLTGNVTGNVSGTSKTITDILPISLGGTGKSTATEALTALLPSQVSASGYYLKTDGSTSFWASASSSLQNSYLAGATITTTSGSSVEIAGAASFKITTSSGIDLTNTKITTSTTNRGITLQPNGTGAFIAESTSYAGNSRGGNAVDLQLIRNLGTQVASGLYSTLVGGMYNSATGDNSVVVGGRSNTASAYYSSIVGGMYNSATTQSYAATVGGYGNLSAHTAAVAMGFSSYTLRDGDFVIGNQSPVLTVASSATYNHFRVGGDNSDVHIGRQVNQASYTIYQDVLFTGGIGTSTFTGYVPVNGTAVKLTATGSLASPFTAGTTYYVVNGGTSTFALSATLGGSPIVTTTNFNGGLQLQVPPSNRLHLHTTNASNQYNSVTLEAPSNLTSPVNLVLPSSKGTAGQCLSTDGSGQMSWQTVSPSLVQGTQRLGTGGYTYSASGTASVSSAAPAKCVAINLNIGTYLVIAKLTVKPDTTCDFTAYIGVGGTAINYYNTHMYVTGYHESTALMVVPVVITQDNTEVAGYGIFSAGSTLSAYHEMNVLKF